MSHEQRSIGNDEGAGNRKWLKFRKLEEENVGNWKSEIIIPSTLVYEGRNTTMA